MASLASKGLTSVHATLLPPVQCEGKALMSKEVKTSWDQSQQTALSSLQKWACEHITCD